MVLLALKKIFLVPRGQGIILWLRRERPQTPNKEDFINRGDTHDTEEFADEFEPVEVKFAYSLKHKRVLTVERDEETFNQVKKLAEGAGKWPGVLIRTWVLGHIKK